VELPPPGPLSFSLLLTQAELYGLLAQKLGQSALVGSWEQASYWTQYISSELSLQYALITVVQYDGEESSIQMATQAGLEEDVP
jgi:hypothetical protein